ncbi:MAG: GNAT family N-acetyltransferase, partial [Alphaproteobacteria bacterium]|nr:GNAT family N-acetyltransferase [Alphaproteobacteria bacterium]
MSVESRESRDPARLSVLHCACFAVGWNDAQMVSLLGVPGTVALIATDASGQDAGFAIFRTVLDESEIITFGVLPALRGHGIGHVLLASLVAHARSAGAEKIFLEVGEDNDAARALYAAQGFVPMGR